MSGPGETKAESVIEINVGGVCYTTTLTTLTKCPGSLLNDIFTDRQSLSTREHCGRVFLDRDGVLFRFVLDYLRNQKLILPEGFQEHERLKHEAEHFRLPDLVKCISAVFPASTSTSTHRAPSPNSAALSPLRISSNGGPGACVDGKESGYVIIGYRGSFAFGRDGGVADVKFRKLLRILVSGRVSLCKEVFGDTLNESRDPDRGDNDRYTARFFLKHTFLEQAFDMLQEASFRLVGSCASGTNSAGDVKPGMDSEESKWNHYNEFVFCRP